MHHSTQHKEISKERKNKPQHLRLHFPMLKTMYIVIKHT